MEIFIYFLILIIFFFLSWIFSGFETGIISLDRFKLEQEAKKSKIKKNILHFYDNNDKTFGTTLIGNNIANVIIAAVSTLLFYELLGFDNTLASLITAFLVLIFCEILPKNLFRDFPDFFIAKFMPFIKLCYILFFPFVKIVTLMNNSLKKILKITDENTFMAFTKDDLAFIVTQTFNEGTIQKPQKEMLEDALEFSDLKAKNVMTPRTEIVAISDEMTIDEIQKYATLEGYTRYPVYHETLDEITGVLIIYDLLKSENKNLTIAKELQREIFFAPESMDVDDLLRELQNSKKSMAVLVDAYGGTSGIVTVEDILEEIVGNIDDEYDIEDIKDVEKINDNTWIANAYVEVDDLIDLYNIALPHGDYETIAGLIISHLAKIPIQGTILNVDNYKIEVIEVTNKKIEKVKITQITHNT
ncbi:MAG: hemolysin family protein [Candidatus Cloacimonetes bacterium]|jgi:putative hemolysin|nr:hemolysin family protein [Candidatus Cloacimonadota bacterium]MDD4156870.1 hemolysin family protein [Candidatus Cloacimonadota bacterium]